MSEDRQYMGTAADAKAALIEKAKAWRETRQPSMDTAAGHRERDSVEREQRFQLANATLLWLWHEENPDQSTRPPSLVDREAVVEMLKRNGFTSRDGTYLQGSTYDVIDAILSLVNPQDKGVAMLAAGCCSATSPCAHQKRDPDSICETCKAALSSTTAERPDDLYRLRDLIASHFDCESDCQKSPSGCGCALNAARALSASATAGREDVDKAQAWDAVIAAREDERQKCAEIATEYNDCGGDFIAQKIRDRAVSHP